MRGRSLNFRIHAQSVSTLAKSIAPHWQYPATIDFGKTRQFCQTERQPTALLCFRNVNIMSTQIRDSRSPMNAPERPKKEVNDSLEQSVEGFAKPEKVFLRHVPIYV